ncbi:unnamed protein product [Penicillium bialowiezense]
MHTLQSPNRLNLLISTMLRRKPTAIAITSEDLASFEEARLRKLSEENKQNEAYSKGASHAKFDPSDELKPLPGDKARIVRSREERIGLGGRA